MAYVAPNEDTVVVCGGLGTMANAAELNGGGATKAVWDANSPSDFINTNGGPKRTASCAFTTASKNLNGTDIGNGVTVGTLCYVSTGDGTHITAGIYEITTVTDNDNIVCAQIDDDGTNDTGVTVNVGGAIDTLQHVFDNPVNDASSYSRYIYINGIVNDADGTIDVGTAIDIDVNAGTGLTLVVVVGYNATLTAKSQVVLQGTADINALIVVNAIAFWFFESFDFDAGGTGKANHCFFGTLANSDDFMIVDCTLRRATDEAGYFGNGDGWIFLDCEVHSCGSGGAEDGGIITDGGDGANFRIYNCSIHDNNGDGIRISGPGATVFNNLVYDNSSIGIYLVAQTFRTLVIGNTCYINDGDNIRINSGAYQSHVFNNVCVGSTGGYGFNLDGNLNLKSLGFGYNLSAGNNSGHTDISGTFANLGLGGNIASAQAAATIFTNVTDGSEDFTPKAGSDLIDNALDAGTA